MYVLQPYTLGTKVSTQSNIESSDILESESSWSESLQKLSCLRLSIFIHQPATNPATAELPHPASIRWVVFHGTSWEIGPQGYFQTNEQVKAIDALVSQLPQLEKVVFEDEYQDGYFGPRKSLSENRLNRKNGAQVARLFRNVVGKIHVWTDKDAQKYANYAYDNGLPSKEQLPIRSYRCAQCIIWLYDCLTCSLAVAGWKQNDWQSGAD